MITKYKVSNYITWNQFGIICDILQYSLEYFDYFSQKDYYNVERNINEYNKIYKRTFNDRYVKDEKFQENKINKIYYSKNVYKS